jgi:hypothetical protein
MRVQGLQVRGYPRQCDIFLFQKGRTPESNREVQRKRPGMWSGLRRRDADLE